MLPSHHADKPSFDIGHNIAVMERGFTHNPTFANPPLTNLKLRLTNATKNAAGAAMRRCRQQFFSVI